MKLATNIKSVKEFGFQLILDETKFVIGVNLLYNKKILIKKRFTESIVIINQTAEKELVNKVIMECFQKEIIINKNDNNNGSNSNLFATFMSAK